MERNATRPTESSRPGGGWMVPKEHGAYFQLLIPMAVAWMGGRPTVAAAMLTVAPIALFLAHEPLLVLLGQRGARAKRESGSLPGWWLGGLSVVAAAGGSLGLWLGGAHTALAALLPLALGTALAGLTVSRSERTVLGESLAAAALAACALPVALACGVSLARAVSAWVVWTAGLAGCTAAVRNVVASHKGRREPIAFVILVLVSFVVVGGAAFVDPGVGVAAPLLAAAWGLVVARPHPRELRRVGWALVASSVATSALLVWVARMPL